MLFFIQVLTTVYPVMAESLAQAQHGIEATTGVAPASQHPLFDGAAFTIEAAMETGFLG